METKDIQLISLYRYFIWADRLRGHFDKAVLSSKNTKHSIERMWADDYGLFMAHWYGSLYVVVEGWKRTNLKNPTIDKLLESPNVYLLKQFRHGTFHFQEKYFDQRFVRFWENSDETVGWVRQLNNAFNRFFLDRMGSGIDPSLQNE
ncbi:MAG: hypothetical protein ABSH16_07655 [Sedimentisphaerales bacterium]